MWMRQGRGDLCGISTTSFAKKVIYYGPHGNVSETAHIERIEGAISPRRATCHARISHQISIGITSRRSTMRLDPTAVMIHLS